MEQLGIREAVNPKQGITSEEIASCVGRTLTLPIVQEHRSRIAAESTVFALSEREEQLTATVGIADAVALDTDDRPIFVFDWKSTVNPTPEDIAKHRAQLAEYMDVLGISSGAVVYMTTGQVWPVDRQNASRQGA